MVVFCSPAVQALLRTYLLRDGERVVERPQFLYMRVALAIHGPDISAALETYEMLSRRMYTHASPTLVNAGTMAGYCASCFIVAPDASTPRNLLRATSTMDDLWMADGGIGTSLGSVPGRQ